jgi:hypothetical protein
MLLATKTALFSVNFKNRLHIALNPIELQKFNVTVLLINFFQNRFFWH